MYDPDPKLRDALEIAATFGSWLHRLVGTVIGLLIIVVFLLAFAALVIAAAYSSDPLTQSMWVEACSGMGGILLAGLLLTYLAKRPVLVTMATLAGAIACGILAYVTSGLLQSFLVEGFGVLLFLVMGEALLFLWSTGIAGVKGDSPDEEGS
jgi:hypothetical protein